MIFEENKSRIKFIFLIIAGRAQLYSFWYSGVGTSKGWLFYQVVEWEEMCQQHALLAYIYD